MKHKLALPSNELILYALALAQTFGIGYALISYDGGSLMLTAIATLRGMLLGAALSFGLVIAAQRVPRVQSKRARQVGYFTLGGLLLVSPVIMAPAVYSAMPAHVRNLPDVLLWVVAVSVAVAPDFVAVALGSVNGATQPAEVRPVVVKPAEPAAPVFRCAKCGAEFEKQNSLNAHARVHRPVAYSLEIKPVEGRK